MGRIIGIVGLKGGVGKTSTVVALGGALYSLGKRILLVDGNFSAPNLGLHTNIVEPEITLHNVFERSANIKDAIYSTPYFDLLPSSLFTNIKINPLKLKDKLRYIKKNYDLILIDSSPALNDETLATMLASDNLIAITTPDSPTLGTTLKAIKDAKQRGIEISGLVLNKVYNKNFEIPLKQVENFSESPVLAVIPHDVNILKSQAKSIPSTILRPNSESSKEYKKLAAVLVGERYGYPKMRKFFRKVDPRKQDVNRDLLYDRVFG